MSCNVTITNNDMSSSRTTFTVLAEDGQDAGKGKVVFSRALPSGNVGVFDVSQPSVMVGISAKQYKQDEVADLDILDRFTTVGSKGVKRITVIWNGNSFDIRQQ